MTTVTASSTAPTVSRAPRRALLAEWLFGRELERRRLPLRTIATIVVMLAVGILVTTYRLPADQRDVLWAEDGRDFLTDAFRYGYLSNLFTPYAGYMHLVPRTAAQLVAWLVPLDELGRGMNLFGAAVWSAVALAAFVFTRDRLQLPLRWLLWLLVLIVPIGSMEVATNVANSHWFLMFGLVMALLARTGPSLPRVIFAAAMVAAAVLSDPLSLLFAPLVLARMLWLPRTREQIVSLVFVLAAAVQVLVVIGADRDRGAPGLEPRPLGVIYLLRVVWGNFLGPVDGQRLYLELGRAAVLAIAAGGLLALVVFIALRWRRTGAAAVALGFSLVFYAVVAVLTWASYGRQPLGLEVYWGGRYSLVPILLLLFSITATVSVWLPSAGTRHRAIRVLALAVVAALLIAPGIANFRTPVYKAGSVPLSDSLENADHLCELNPGADASLPIAPPPKYDVVIPCEVVLEHR